MLYRPHMDTKKFHAIGHSRLSDWAQKRAADLAGLGWAGMSATEKMRQRAHGGSASTAPGVLTPVEQHVDARGRTLQTELAVRALTEAQRAAVSAQLAAEAAERRAAADELRARLDAQHDEIHAAIAAMHAQFPRRPRQRRPFVYLFTESE